MKKKRGFTLIELLVVMTIIAVLAGLALVSYQGARKSARDGKRKSDLEQIRGALEMCYSDMNEYPGDISGSVGTYLSPTPTDPVSGDDYVYNPELDATGSIYVRYTLCADLETDANPYCVSSP